MIGEFLKNEWACVGFTDLVTTPGYHSLVSFTKECHNKSFDEIKDLIGSYITGGWGAFDGQLARWLQLSPDVEDLNDKCKVASETFAGDIIMVRLSSACEACPISHDMLPSLFNVDGTFKVHKNSKDENNHQKGVYFIGRVTSLPSPESFPNIATSSPVMRAMGWDQVPMGRMYVTVKWLKMGYLADVKSGFTYVKTYVRVSDTNVRFKNKVLSNAIYEIPDIVAANKETLERV